MGKVKPNSNKGRKGPKISYARINLFIIPLFVGLFLVTFFIVQGIGERLQWFPVITLNPTSWTTSSEAVLFFVLSISICLIITFNLVIYLLNRR